MGHIVYPPRADRTLTDGGLYEHGEARHGGRVRVALRQVGRALQELIGLVLRAAYLHRFKRGGDDGRVQPRLRPREGEQGAVVRGIDIVYGILIYNGVERVYQRGIVGIGHVLLTDGIDELRVAGHAGRAEEADKLAEFERVVYLKRDLRSGRKDQNVLHLGHARHLLHASPCARRRRSFLNMESR